LIFLSSPLPFAVEACRLRAGLRPDFLPGRGPGAPPAADRWFETERKCRALPRDSRAFTLVELLLTVSLLLLLLGAVVFSFTNLRRGSSLDEGVTQLEALLRFARAQAAGAGRQVQINFEEKTGDGRSAPLGSLRVLWEPDPLTRPGLFEELREAEPYIRGIAELISIEDVRSLEQAFAAGEPVSHSGAAGKMGPGAVTTVSEADSADSLGFAPITFYPDGSSDSAEIVLASKDQDDDRMIGLQFAGVTGTFRRRLIPRDFASDQSTEEVVKASRAEPIPVGTDSETARDLPNSR
jgi:type II secretory pathway pseudopilin PulG